MGAGLVTDSLPGGDLRRVQLNGVNQYFRFGRASLENYGYGYLVNEANVDQRETEKSTVMFIK